MPIFSREHPKEEKIRRKRWSSDTRWLLPWAGPQGQYITELERERVIHLSGRYLEETNYTQISIHAILRLLLSVSIITAEKKKNEKQKEMEAWTGLEFLIFPFFGYLFTFIATHQLICRCPAPPFFTDHRFNIISI